MAIILWKYNLWKLWMSRSRRRRRILGSLFGFRIFGKYWKREVLFYRVRSMEISGCHDHCILRRTMSFMMTWTNKISCNVFAANNIASSVGMMLAVDLVLITHGEISLELIRTWWPVLYSINLSLFFIFIFPGLWRGFYILPQIKVLNIEIEKRKGFHFEF